MNRFAKWTLPAFVLALVVGGKAYADNEKGTATIKGRVVYDGEPPAAKPLPPMNADAVCQKHHGGKPVPDQSTIVYKKDGNAIPYVFVYVKNGIKGKYDAPSEPVVIDQKGCTYHPHVFGMVAGQQITIKNSDPTNHNIHSLAKKNPQFNFAQPNKDMVRELKGNETFTKPEIMAKIKCDVHAWMSTWVGVCAHPFYSVTKSHDDHNAGSAEKGTYEIKNLPAGDYEIEFWHEAFGSVTEKVSVKDGETKEVNVKLGPNSKKADASQAREVILGNEVGTSPEKK